MVDGELGSHHLLLKLRGILLLLLNRTEQWDLKLYLLVNISHGQRGLLTILRDLDGKHQVVHEANDPDILEGVWIVTLQIKQWGPLLAFLVESTDNTIIIHGGEASFVAEADPGKVGSLGHWALPIVQSMVES
jgi:hypothetical protein